MLSEHLDAEQMPGPRLLKLIDREALAKMRYEQCPALPPRQTNRSIEDIRSEIVPPSAAARKMASRYSVSVSKSRPSMSRTTAAGFRGNLTELCAIGSRVQTIGHALPIGITRVSLKAVLPSDVSIKLERRARLEARRILTKMLA